MEIPSTRYARAIDGDSIAYQVVGDGPFDLVYVPGFISHVELWWAEPSIGRFYERLASFSRLILFDKRGTGLSDPISGPQPLEERMEDVRTVMDAAGSERAALVGLSEGSAMAAVFAATYPQRTSALVLMGPILGGVVEEHPAGEAWTDACRRFQTALGRWGDGSTLRLVGPSMSTTARQLGLVERAGASPRMARELAEVGVSHRLRRELGERRARPCRRCRTSGRMRVGGRPASTIRQPVRDGRRSNRTSVSPSRAFPSWSPPSVRCPRAPPGMSAACAARSAVAPALRIRLASAWQGRCSSPT